MENPNVYWSKVVSSFFDRKPFYIAATDKGLCRILWPNESFEKLRQWVNQRIPNATLIQDEQKMIPYQEQLQAYFRGERQNFDVPLDLYGTPFQVKTWNAINQITFGDTKSYGDIATAIGNPKAVRAVGTATGTNPIPIMIPCHRVIGKNKTLTGFGGGFSIKKKLLHLEGYTNYIDKGHAKYQY